MLNIWHVEDLDALKLIMLTNMTYLPYRLRMAEWLRRSLAEWKVPGSNLTMGKVSGKKTKQKKPSYPLLAWCKSGWWECSPTRKKAGVCAIMSIWLVHIKEHVWTVGTCLTTVLLSTVTMCMSVCVNGSTEGLWKEDLRCMRLADLYAPQGVDLGEGGSFSYWCDTVKWLAWAASNVKCTWKPSQGSCGALYKWRKFKFNMT